MLAHPVEIPIQRINSLTDTKNTMKIATSKGKPPPLPPCLAVANMAFETHVRRTAQPINARLIANQVVIIPPYLLVENEVYPKAIRRPTLVYIQADKKDVKK